MVCISIKSLIDITLPYFSFTYNIITCKHGWLLKLVIFKFYNSEKYTSYHNIVIISKF